jgi:hypothetical protein
MFALGGGGGTPRQSMVDPDGWRRWRTPGLTQQLRLRRPDRHLHGSEGHRRRSTAVEELKHGGERLDSPGRARFEPEHNVREARAGVFPQFLGRPGERAPALAPGGAWQVDQEGSGPLQRRRLAGDRGAGGFDPWPPGGEVLTGGLRQAPGRAA